MEKNSAIYKKYVEILHKELIPAMGCTEPIAISFCAAKAHEVLGKEPERVLVEASGNLIKNVKSVVVPNTNGMKGIEVAVAAGIIAGKSEKLLEVISEVTTEEKEKIAEFIKNKEIKVDLAKSKVIFDLTITLFAGDESSSVRIIDEHTNIVTIKKNGKIIEGKEITGDSKEEAVTDVMSICGIIDFAKTCDLEDVKDVLQRQIEYNSAIAEEGIKNSWGANVGKVLLKYNDANQPRVRAKAFAAAGSDARMSGCELPVVINSGSGNQGITVTMPILEFSKAFNSSKEDILRALVLSNLISLHIKFGIGRLSAYCGAVSAGCASAAGIAYLNHDSDWVIKHTISNGLAVASGIICDGAKPSCAGKIASSVDAGIMGWDMAKEQEQFKAGEGIVKKDIENMISSVARLGKEGMRETDIEILKIMLDK